MKLSTASQLILALGLSCLMQVNAKGLKGRANVQKRNLQVDNQKGQKGTQKEKVSTPKEQFDIESTTPMDREETAFANDEFGGQTQKEKGSGPKEEFVIKSTTPMDREETAFANDEFGETLYVPINVDDENEDTEGFWNFSDLNDEDREDLGPSDFVIEVEEPEDGEEVAEEEAEGTTSSTIVEDTADVAGSVGDILNDFFAMASNKTDEELHEIAEELSNNILPLDGVYVHEDADLEEELEQLEEEESDLTVDDAPNEEWAADNSKLAARITEAEIQLDSLLQLDDKVTALQIQLARALAIIEEQKNAINTLATMLRPASDATASDTDP